MKAITLFSGGMDSLVSTFIAKQKGHKIILAITFDYGQRAAKREMSAARKICELWKIPHKAIKLPWLAEITDTALVNKKKKLPIICHPEGVCRRQTTEGSPEFSTGDPSLSLKMTTNYTARAVWVPNRNGLFINIAAGFAESFGAELIITGFNKEEASTFPDNSKKFVFAINQSLKHSTLKRLKSPHTPLCKRGERGDFKHPRVVSYTQNMSKADMAAYAARHDLPLRYCWPCYEGGKKMCGRCESCARFMSALNKITIYEN